MLKSELKLGQQTLDIEPNEVEQLETLLLNSADVFPLVILSYDELENPSWSQHLLCKNRHKIEKYHLCLARSRWD